MDRDHQAPERILSVIGAHAASLLWLYLALSEVLVRAGSAGSAYLDRLHASVALRIGPFDQRAAVDVAATTQDALAAGNKRGGAEGTWAKVEGAHIIYLDDEDVRRLAMQSGFAVRRIAKLLLPLEMAQGRLDSEALFEAPDDTEEADETR